MKTIEVLIPGTGEVVELPVLVRIKKRCPYKRWSVINLSYHIDFEKSVLTPDLKVFLGLLTEQGPITAKDLATKTNTPLRSVYRSLRAFCGIGFVQEGKKGMFSLSNSLVWNGRWGKNDE